MLASISFSNFLRKVLLLDYIKDAQALEFQNSFIKIVIGLMFLVSNGTTFYAHSNLYNYVRWLHPHWWGFIFLACGVFHQYCLFKNKKQGRKNILWFAGVLWVSFASSLLLGDVRALSGYIYLIFAISSFRCYLAIQVFKRFDYH
jgi:hypothetical protein